MPYGGDVQDLSRCPNLLYKHTMAQSYPLLRMGKKIIQSKIDLWTRNADHIIAGCDWVDYLYYWDTLMLAHFSIDTEKIHPSLNALEKNKGTDLIRILHAPNHRAIKGTQSFIDAVDSLKKEGYNIELIIIEKRPNSEVIDLIKNVDIVADQLIIGWYAMFALEAMALGKPVICHIREDLRDLFIFAGLLKKDELPFIICDSFNLKENLRYLLQNPSKLNELGKKSREYVEKHHSLESVGAVFSKINKQLNIFPEQNE
jgi:glycosyltransferase involved in cell wall biosynthesis